MDDQNKLNSSILSTDALGHISKENEEIIKNRLQFTSNVIKSFGYDNQNYQLTFRILMFKNSPLTEKIKPVLEDLFQALKPVEIRPNFKAKAICIFDKNKGYNGRYTLVMNDQNQFAIIKETNNHIEFNKNFKSFKDISEALAYISKNLYYYEK